MQTLRMILLDITDRLKVMTGTFISAEQEAWWIVEHVTAQSKAKLLCLLDCNVSARDAEKISVLVYRRVNDLVPLQYLLGTIPFGDLTLNVRPPIFIPRQETEEWLFFLVSRLQNFRHKTLKILDLCTGSGCVALFLAQYFSHSTVIGIDKNPDAVALAQENAQLNGLKNCSFKCGDLYETLDTGNLFDLIVSNPPYLASHEMNFVGQSEQKWESLIAFVSGVSGMEVYEKILQDAHKFLLPGSIISHSNYFRLSFEIGYSQGNIEECARLAGFSEVKVYKDLQGKDRWVTIQV